MTKFGIGNTVRSPYNNLMRRDQPSSLSDLSATSRFFEGRIRICNVESMD
jgi:hypothetical protein